MRISHLVIQRCVAAKASENINVPIVVKGSTHHIVIWIRAVQRVVVARPVVCPLPFALGGGGEEGEKGGEQGYEKFGKIQRTKS